ncbi:MAG TPA: glycoside hydrolase family 57 protein [Verrucomicrobiae bacterium]|nr:glycoside hydrolase family 57 protein [Verrucomicrobiae bacterium]
MPSVCFYFQVHQPYRMRPYRVFDIGTKASYFNDELNKEICEKVARKCYLPTNKLMLQLIKENPGKFKISYSISGITLEQFEEYSPEVLASFKELAATGQVEFLAETYYHSLSALFDPQEFRSQVEKHVEAIKEHFGVTPTAFRNTELIYSNEIAAMVEAMGFKVMLTEGADQILGHRSPAHVYAPMHSDDMKLLLKSYKLSDDIAFRFSERSWPSWPLTPDKFAMWAHKLAGNGETLNLFMDYETFGEHQWEETGIFEFLRHLPAALLKHPDFDFATPSEVADRYPAREKLDVPIPISWADMERDTSAWLGNPMQDGAIAWVYKVGEQVRATNDPKLLHTWRKLQTSDHFYYMCTKFWADGDVHKHFSCYESPHEAYVYLSNILTDLEMLLEEHPVHAKKRSMDAFSAPKKRPEAEQPARPTSLPRPRRTRPLSL